MSDRELLELAAKAAGIDAHWGEGWQSDMMFIPVPRPHSPLVTNVQWNPLGHDGDALRLAVKLQMEIAIFDDECHTKCMERGQSDWTEEQGDPYAATRRAIVKAAAEIGRQMP